MTSEPLSHDQRPRVERRLFKTKDPGPFADRHADVVEVAERQRREPATIDGSLGQLVSFKNSAIAETPKSARE
jgi:hypothetical protein